MKNIIILITVLTSTSINFQEIVSANFIDLTHSFLKSSDASKPNSNRANECDSNFWTINDNGEIQQWNLEGNVVTGGDVILTGGGGSGGLAYCGDPNSITFYCGNPPDAMRYYDYSKGWVDIPMEDRVNNNGGYENDQYYLTYANTKLVHYDEVNITTIDSLHSGRFTVFDVAVDARGQAWAFQGPEFGSTTQLNVYNQTGLITSYDITFDSTSSYGSFILNGILYIGMAIQGANPNTLTPIIFNGDNAELGTPIDFPWDNYHDMASCVNEIPLGIPDFSNSGIKLFPNPTSGIIKLSTNINVRQIEIYNFNGQLMQTYNQVTGLNLSGLSNGVYFIKIQTSNRVYIEKIIKQ